MSDFDLVLFASSFRQDGSRGGEESPNISHALLVGSDRTLCGRRGWEINEGRAAEGAQPDCLRCSAKLAKLVAD